MVDFPLIVDYNNLLLWVDSTTKVSIIETLKECSDILKRSTTPNQRSNENLSEKIKNLKKAIDYLPLVPKNNPIPKKESFAISYLLVRQINDLLKMNGNFAIYSHPLMNSVEGYFPKSKLAEANGRMIKELEKLIFLANLESKKDPKTQFHEINVMTDPPKSSVPETEKYSKLSLSNDDKKKPTNITNSDSVGSSFTDHHKSPPAPIWPNQHRNYEKSPTNEKTNEFKNESKYSKKDEQSYTPKQFKDLENEPKYSKKDEQSYTPKCFKEIREIRETTTETKNTSKKSDYLREETIYRYN